MRCLLLVRQLIGTQKSRHVGCSIPVPPGRSMRQDSAPTISQISRHYETNDVSAAEDPTAFAPMCYSQYLHFDASTSQYLRILRYN
jgi:hypothetical protein